MKPARFGLTTRVLHWLMAGLIVSMLLIGAGMTTSLRHRPWLFDTHVTLGLAILALAGMRLASRLRGPVPELPGSLPRWQAMAARASHGVLYLLMFLQPLVGWASLSAGGYPSATIAGHALRAPISADPWLYTQLRNAHEMLGYAFLAVILLHIAAALLHALVLRDGVFGQIALTIGRRSPAKRRTETRAD